MKKPGLTGAGIGILLAAGLSPAGFAQVNPAPVPASPSADAPQPAPTTVDFVAAVSSSDQLEIASGQLALTRSQDAGVQQLAQMLVDDHTNSTTQLTAIVSAQGLRLTSTMLPRDQELLEALQEVEDDDFDRVFVTQQQVIHEEAITLFTAYASDGDNEALRTFAEGALPVLQHHLDTINQLLATP